MTVPLYQDFGLIAELLNTLRETDMPAPSPTPEFKSIVGLFCPYADEVYSSAEEMVDAGWQTLLESQLETAKAYLDELLSGKYSEEELRDVWRASNANVSPFRGAEGNCTEFLEFIRSRYDKFERSWEGDG